MMMEALANGGVALVVCSTVEAGRKKFENMLSKIVSALSGDNKIVKIDGKGRGTPQVDFSQIPGISLEEKIHYIRERILFAPILDGLKLVEN